MNGDQKSDIYAQEEQDFIQPFSQIVKALTEDEMGHPETGDAIARLKEVPEYNAIGGKYSRRLTVVATFQELVDLGKQDADSLQRALTVGWCVELLRAFFLVSDDIMDSSITRPGQSCCVTGKVGTDIQDSECSWLVVQCLQRATPEQPQILWDNYGQKDAKKVAQVRALYQEMNLPAVFSKYEEDSYSHLMSLIEQCAAPLTPNIFLGLANKIYRRKK
ncbi:Farnesyl pyrophosphate synthase [Sciurus carolinensis]|uniref:(2E,6E)-farnesyl diphosphate synthase n=1 Tax=Sciurus carolinensis TaxID=30640 RepID=A0AA41MTA6_SCICA|nr:Farnesyl pyrophosphate synthase [Sciurus carolinensis]